MYVIYLDLQLISSYRTRTRYGSAINQSTGPGPLDPAPTTQPTNPNVGRQVSQQLPSTLPRYVCRYVPLPAWSMIGSPPPTPPCFNLPTICSSFSGFILDFHLRSTDPTDDVLLSMRLTRRRRRRPSVMGTPPPNPPYLHPHMPTLNIHRVLLIRDGRMRTGKGGVPQRPEDQRGF